MIYQRPWTFIINGSFPCPLTHASEVTESALESFSANMNIQGLALLIPGGQNCLRLLWSLT